MIFEFLLRRATRAILGPPDAVRMADQVARHAMKTGFRTFRDRELRASVRFDELETVEQDRIFNELVVSNLVLALLMLDTFVKLANGQVKEFFRTVCGAISERFAMALGAMGVADEHVRIWIKLLNLRRDEYEAERLRVRGVLPEIGEGNPWLRLVAVGCLFHIRRGQDIAQDPLLTILLHQAIAVSARTQRTVVWAARRL